jgi:hypothetical protein
MKKSKLERSLVVVLFILVLVIFSFAERDSKKVSRLYTETTLMKKVKSSTVAGVEREHTQAAISN